MAASIPAWVPVVFLVLLLLGYRQSLTRTVRPSALVAIALAMFGFSLYGVIAAFGLVALALVLWAGGYGAAAFIGAGLVSTSRMAVVGSSVRLPGSWVPLALLLSIFAAKFTLGFAAGVHSPVLHSTWFVAAMSCVLGTLGGGFSARALAVHRFASTAQPLSGRI